MDQELPPKIDAHLSDATKSFHDQIDELRTIAEENLHYSKSLHESDLRNGSITSAHVYQLLERNVALTEQLTHTVQKLHRWLQFQVIWFWLKVALVIVPIVLGAIFLPPVIRDFVEQYKSITQALSLF